MGFIYYLYNKYKGADSVWGSIEGVWTRGELAEHLGVTPQYVSRLLSGRVNFSFKSVAELEEKLGITLLQVVTSNG